MKSKYVSNSSLIRLVVLIDMRFFQRRRVLGSVLQIFRAIFSNLSPLGFQHSPLFGAEQG